MLLEVIYQVIFLQSPFRQVSRSVNVIEILEHFDMKVIYDFDRTHEGMEDVYWAASQEQGFQFRFDESQKLDVIFLYLVSREGFIPIRKEEIDVQVYDSFLAAKHDFEKSGFEYKKSPSEEPNDPWYQRWIKVNNGGFTRHYEFMDGQPRMITLGLFN